MGVGVGMRRRGAAAAIARTRGGRRPPTQTRSPPPHRRCARWGMGGMGRGVLASISLSASTYRKAVVAQPGTGPGVMLWPRCPWPVRFPCTVRLYAAFSRLLFTASSFSTIRR
eukprot:scaffold32325_cov65-Phaeocystis_antarctica.AAC.2